jgi:protein-L-isoaspartate(D-aspartate) O-methyltransferase
MDKKELIDSLRMQGFSENIMEAFMMVQREEFIDEGLKGSAYEDHPLPIGFGQTISQPTTIAIMLELLELKDSQKILEIGSGSGYVLALIAYITRNSEIYGVERMKNLAERSMEVLKNHKNVMIVHADGTRGLKENAPFDRILVSASADKIPEKIIEQLIDGGIAVIPIKNSIMKIRRKGKEYYADEYYGFTFVPLVED